MLGTLCTLSAVLSCVSGVTVVTQKPPVLTVSKGDTATMDCNLETVTDSGARWYKQVPGFCTGVYIICITVVFGQGTKLSVTDSSIAAPTLSLLPPSSEELKTDKATLVCLAQMSVMFADVSWTSAGSPVTDGVFTSAAEQKPDKSFGLSSFLTIKSSEWISNRVFTCKVSVGSKATVKSIEQSDCSE
ncbi:hypothetical protein SKAU_G00301550 [Synaphobranchus kaupii]|uniref:Ig-like domain-containing protein n=1 Tax=Synaphobranchus kaupii TaxID=118154 RepID=A0A9Q1EVX8_SYNKA|nr:hypothetical protein SKAU_G00301550 [Synaphobranchus kaupii]